MKKSLAILGLLMAFSQPVFAQCSSCGQHYIGAAVPVTTLSPCNTYVRVVPIAKTYVKSYAVVPGNPCNPCATGAAVPINVPTIAVDPDYKDYACCSKHGFWKNFFSF